MTRLLGVVAVGAALVLGLPAMADAAAKPHKGTTCTGNLAAGTYHKLVVPAGAVCTSAGHVTILGGVYIGPGATFVLGSEDTPRNTSTVNGPVRATRPASVQIHFTRINGGVDIRGGSGPSGGPFGITWTTIEDSWIHGGATIVGYNGFWMGFIRNHVNGTVTLSNNHLVDEDANEYVTNVIHGSLRCYGNDPAPHVGDSEGGPNRVTGQKLGQCAKL